MYFQSMSRFTEDESDILKSDTYKQKVAEEKRQREHLLQLNQILAKQVMEKSKMVAGKDEHFAIWILCCFARLYTL